MDDGCAMSNERPSLLIGGSLSLPLILFVETDAKQHCLLIKLVFFLPFYKSASTVFVIINQFKKFNRQASDYNQPLRS
ncbi:hypothetical protein T4E_8876 [Trichinella pseudospiralis]|uniref:Uncharacterized protein n=1 Tax=Trichinella pseudospiralis TaxID=6337 RepID=A0A0V0XX75_TRIPS|nr:hypothetical protein T4E_8876 [Trichinella pseudospiralis]